MKFPHWVWVGLAHSSVLSGSLSWHPRCYSQECNDLGYPTLETVHTRGSHLVVLAPECRQEACLSERSMSFDSLPFINITTFTEKWPPYVRKPGHPVLPAASGQFLADFHSPGGWRSELQPIWVSHASSQLLTLPRTQPPPQAGLPLASLPSSSRAPQAWLCLAVPTQGHRPMALLVHGLVGTGICAWPSQPPAPRRPTYPHSPVLWASVHLILPILHPSTFYYVPLSSTVPSCLLPREA